MTNILDNRMPKLAILLAAGYGMRMRPLTFTKPKALINVKGQPYIWYALNEMVKCSVKKVYIVTSYLEDQIIRYVLETWEKDLQIDFFHQNKICGTSDAVLTASRNISTITKITKYFIISSTDYAYPNDYVKNIIDFHVKGSQDISISLRKVNCKKVNDSSIVEFDSTGGINKIIEKPHQRFDIDKIAATLLYIVPINIFRFLEKNSISQRGEYELVDVINEMIDSGFTARGLLQNPLQ